MKRTLALLVVLTALAWSAVAFALDIADTVPPEGRVGVPYSWTLTTPPGSGTEPLSWVVPHSGVFPPGLVTSTSQRGRFLHVTGTPTQAGTFRFFIQLRDAPGPWTCCTEEQFTIRIAAAATPPPPPPPPPPPVGAFPLTVTAGPTASTLRLSWPRQAADGYVFYLDGRLVARTRDPKRTTVVFSRGAGEYRVCPGDLVTGQKPCALHKPSS